MQTSNQRTKLQLRTNPIKTFPKEASRFRKPRISTPQPQLRTATIKTFQGRFEVLQTSNQRTKQQLPTNKLKSFRRQRRPFGGKAAFPLPAATQYRRLRRQKTWRAVLSAGTPCASFYILQGGIPFFAGTHLDDIFYIVYKDLAIADMAGVQRLFRRLDNRADRHLADDDFHLNLRQ